MGEPLALDAAEELICAAVRGERAAWPANADRDFLARVRERAIYHGVQQILHERLKQADAWPLELRSAFRSESISCAIWEMRHHTLLKGAVEGLSAAGIRPILIKGSALVYTHYPNPVLRTRGDTDLIVAAEDMERVNQVLVALGFNCECSIGSTALSNHSIYNRSEADGTSHTIEVHSRLSVSRLISGALPYRELIQRAVACPQLSPAALAHGPLDALLITCLHRTSHKDTPYFANGQLYYGANRLIWLYDIHLIASNLTPREWDALVELARGKGLISVLQDGIYDAQICFKTKTPHAAVAALSEGDRDGQIARCVGASHYGKVWIDFRNLTSVRERLRFLTDVMFPPAEFIRRKHPNARVQWLPWLYVRTLAGVASKWLDRKARQAS